MTGNGRKNNKNMGDIILEGNSRQCNSYTINEDHYSFNKKEKYQAYFLVELKASICSTQIRFVTDVSKTDFWKKEELLFAFYDLENHIKRYIESENPFYIFSDNLFFPKMENKQDTDEIKRFEFSIKEDSRNINQINNDLLIMKEAKENYKKCVDKLFEAISYFPSQMNNCYYGITNLIDYLSEINQVGFSNNSDSLSIIKSAFKELSKRKDINNENYQTTLSRARNKIYCLQFPNYFNRQLPTIDIQKALDEVR